MGLLDRHEENQKEKGPLRPSVTDLEAALAEIQEQLMRRDPTWRPQHDHRRGRQD